MLPKPPAIRSGKLGSDAENKSLVRIGAAKARYGEPLEQYRKKDRLVQVMKTMKRIVGCEAHRTLSEKIVRRVIVS